MDGFRWPKTGQACGRGTSQYLNAPTSYFTRPCQPPRKQTSAAGYQGTAACSTRYRSDGLRFPPRGPASVCLDERSQARLHFIAPPYVSFTMASRYSAARPKRAGEDFARTHQHEGGGLGDGDGKRVRFDVRNPSTLAPDAREENAILEADVIDGSSATKRGAVNLDGYDSDSDNDPFEAKAAGRKQGAVDLLEQLDSYNPKGDTGAGKGGNPADDDDDDDMFAADGDDAQDAENMDKDSVRKGKRVHFMNASRVDGEEDGSKSGGHVRLDEQESSDDEDAELAKEEQGLDEEVGAGGLKRNAPKIEAFNLREEMEQGRFDEAGNYVRQAADPDANHDRWLDGLSKKDMKKAAEAHEKREADARRQRLQEDGVLVVDLLKALILQLEKTETPLEALARLGRKKTRGKKMPKWKLKKLKKGAEGMEVNAEAPEDPAQARIKASIDAITDAADKLLSRDYEDVYDMEREVLAREYKRQTGDDWVEPPPPPAGDADGDLWEYRWTDGRDGGATQGPFDTATMKAWQEAGYFGQGVEFRAVAPGGGDWTPTAAFA